MQISEIEDTKSVIELQLYITYEWKEPQIKTSKNTSSKQIALDRKLKDKLWCPDFFLLDNQKIESKYFIGGGNVQTLFLKSDNILNMDLPIKTSITCKMRFETYPFDSHKCPFRIQSYGYDKTSLHITTK